MFFNPVSVRCSLVGLALLVELADLGAFPGLHTVLPERGEAGLSSSDLWPNVTLLFWGSPRRCYLGTNDLWWNLRKEFWLLLELAFVSVLWDRPWACQLQLEAQLTFLHTPNSLPQIPLAQLCLSF